MIKQLENQLKSVRDATKREQPLIHCITNPISIHGCANMILAVGARPMMAEHPMEGLLHPPYERPPVYHGFCIQGVVFLSEEQSRKKVMTAAISGHDEERGAPGTGGGLRLRCPERRGITSGTSSPSRPPWSLLLPESSPGLPGSRGYPGPGWALSGSWA